MQTCPLVYYGAGASQEFEAPVQSARSRHVWIIKTIGWFALGYASVFLGYEQNCWTLLGWSLSTRCNDVYIFPEWYKMDLIHYQNIACRRMRPVP